MWNADAGVHHLWAMHLTMKQQERRSMEAVGANTRTAQPAGLFYIVCVGGTAE